MRIQLLTSLDNFIQYLDDKTIENDIFPAVSTGFTDTVPAMREMTVKSMLQLTGRLSESVIDNQLLKFLAKAQTDPEPPIRTNTTICISKISCHFSDATKRKVLIPAFLRAVKDPFVHGRNAGVLSLGCTAQYYAEPDIATRILPALCPLLMDHEKVVRDQAVKTVKMFLERIERHHAGIVEPTPAAPRSAQQGQQDTQQAAGWASWATSLASKYVQPTSGTGKIGEITKPSTPATEQAGDATDKASSVPSPQPKKGPARFEPAARTTTPDNGWDNDDMGGWENDTAAPKAKG